MHLRNIDNLDIDDDDKGGLIDTRKDNTIVAAMGLRFDSEDLACAQLNGRYF